jgi:putative transposase
VQERHHHPPAGTGYLAVNAQSAQSHACFKAKDRFPGFGFKTHGDGFGFAPGKGWRHGKLRLSGVGEMRVRGEARTPGRVVCGDIQRKVDGWYLTLVVACEPHRACGDRKAGLDWGVETFATRSRRR